MIFSNDPTPVELVNGVWAKRDDLFTINGHVGGGKARTCDRLINHATLLGKVQGITTAGSRHSPQVAIVARLAQMYGMPCTVYVPAGDNTGAIVAALDSGATVERVRPGHNSVIIARSREHAAARSGWLVIPFGMECQAAVDSTAAQVVNLPFDKFSRIVVPVGSGMTLAGIITGLVAIYRTRGLWPRPTVVAVQVGADYNKRLSRWAPLAWQNWVKLEQVVAQEKYGSRTTAELGYNVPLDPIYEAKCLPYLQMGGDLLWMVGYDWRGGPR